MNKVFSPLILLALALVLANGQDCNVCQLSGHFVAANGYNCIPVAPIAYCTCPDGSFTPGAPCRICDRPTTCNRADPNFMACLESNDFGTTHACLFMGANGEPVITLDPNGNPAVTLTTKATTTTTTASPAFGSCLNGGVLFNGMCNCPSGYSPPICATLSPAQLCDRVNCSSNGYCIVRNYNGPAEASCTCKVPYFGEYCHIQGAVTSCSTGYCNNGGACKEFIGGTTKYAYCECAPGYNGIRCENRYFTCPGAGNWADYQMFAQGKYFECTPLSGGGFRIQQRSCAKGLRFNMNANMCTL